MREFEASATDSPDAERGTDEAMRILLMQTQAENAGAQEISRLLGEGLAARGHDVHHLFFYRRTDSADDLPNVHFCARERPGSLRALAALLADLRTNIRRIAPDVVVPFQHYGVVLGALATRSAGRVPIIANQVSHVSVVNRPLRIADRWLGTAGLYRFITVNSNDLARAFEAYPAGYRKRLVHVPHGFADKSVSLSRADARAQFSLPQDGLILGVTARLNPSKRIDDAIRLLAREPTWHLAVAGQGTDMDRLAGVAKDLGVTDRVHFVGEVPTRRVGEFLAALDIFVFPTEAETFGLAAVEAAQVGLPVVANDIPVLRETLSVDGAPAAAFCACAEGAQFHATVRRIVDDASHRESLLAAGRRLSERYSLAAMIDAYEDLLVRAGTRRP